MIITEEYLIAMEACPEGIDAAKNLNILNTPSDQFIKTLWDNNFHTHAAWVKYIIKSSQSIKYLGSYTVSKYIVFNPTTGLYEDAKTIEEAKVLKDTIINNYVQNHVLNLIDVQEEIIGEDGTVASSKIDL